MKYEVVRDFPDSILFDRGGVCISIYQPTHKNKSENALDKIMFKNQVQKAERSLAQKFSKREIEEFLDPLYKLDQDNEFWNKTKDGLAIFLNKNKCVIYKLDRELKELTVVSDSFHIKPLIRVFQSADKYYVLGLNRKTFKLYYGDRYGLTEIEFAEDVPVEITDVLGDQYTSPHISISKGGTMYGTGSKKDEIEKDIERYLRYIDKFIWENYSKPTGAPLVLVALKEYQGEFRKISGNKYLIEKGIDKDFESLDINTIREESWKIIEAIYLNKTAELVELYNNGKSKELAGDSLEDVSKKAIEGRIETVLLESDKLIPGKVDLETGEIERKPLEDVETDDVLDDIAELVLKSKGEVVMLPKERMPTESGVAAIFRY
ncbi:hypothetical protein SAMN02745245_00265 [Anaerosphaera aminiphila DSM 21120]|uniref:Uncharacterized protein n=1 Tax=Anaerosphaera aminiphila DSM 21120 TaxID=1120995 RepID=A0A1M5PBS1_9FIRM|nr:hypothetical protein [Anaerosphaera aminiphila]SHG99281.1 hypothetical protein SAMN02745245_00265 [Anaerosphaera aminiphila DSM 21120]